MIVARKTKREIEKREMQSRKCDKCIIVYGLVVRLSEGLSGRSELSIGMDNIEEEEGLYEGRMQRRERSVTIIKTTSVSVCDLCVALVLSINLISTSSKLP